MHSAFINETYMQLYYKYQWAFTWGLNYRGGGGYVQTKFDVSNYNTYCTVPVNYTVNKNKIIQTYWYSVYYNLMHYNIVPVI